MRVVQSVTSSYRAFYSVKVIGTGYFRRPTRGESAHSRPEGFLRVSPAFELRQFDSPVELLPMAECQFRNASLYVGSVGGHEHKLQDKGTHSRQTMPFDSDIHSAPAARVGRKRLEPLSSAERTIRGSRRLPTSCQTPSTTSASMLSELSAGPDRCRKAKATRQRGFEYFV